MKKGDRVVMQVWFMPKAKYRSGVVLWEDKYGTVQVKRDGYKGHDNNYFFQYEWKKSKKEKQLSREK